MEYRRFGDKIVVRIDKGEELCETLLDIAGRENIRLAGVYGIGSTDDVTLGAFDADSKTYVKVRYNSTAYELASVTGNLSRMDGRPYLHLHAVIGIPGNNECQAGHLNAAVIRATCEMNIDVIEGEVGRKYSDEVGLNLYEF